MANNSGLKEKKRKMTDLIHLILMCVRALVLPCVKYEMLAWNSA